jgi:hypothetical protein
MYQQLNNQLIGDQLVHLNFGEIVPAQSAADLIYLLFIVLADLLLGTNFPDVITD